MNARSLLPGGNTGVIRRRGKELAILPHMPMAQDKCPLYKALPTYKSVWDCFCLSDDVAF